jgi:hypothetical protein
VEISELLSEDEKLVALDADLKVVDLLFDVVLSIFSSEIVVNCFDVATLIRLVVSTFSREKVVLTVGIIRFVVVESILCFEFVGKSFEVVLSMRVVVGIFSSEQVVSTEVFI